MRRRTMRNLLVTVGLFAAGLAQPTVSRAGILADAWWALFGPAQTSYYPGSTTAYYGGGYQYPTYYGSYYRGGYCPPARPVRVYYPPANCCQPCNPCGSACAGGPCRISDGDEGPSTFKNDGNPPTPKKDSNFKSRKEDGKKTFKRTRKPDDGKSIDGTGTAIKREALKPPVPGKGDGESKKKKESNGKKTEGDGKSGPVIRKKKPAPAKAPVGPGKADGDQQKTAGLSFDRVSLDGTTTWRTPSRRTRLVIRPVLPASTVSRASYPLNQGWKPVRSSGTRLVRK